MAQKLTSNKQKALHLQTLWFGSHDVQDEHKWEVGLLQGSTVFLPLPQTGELMPGSIRHPTGVPHLWMKGKNFALNPYSQPAFSIVWMKNITCTCICDYFLNIFRCLFNEINNHWQHFHFIIVVNLQKSMTIMSVYSNKHLCMCICMDIWIYI